MMKHHQDLRSRFVRISTDLSVWQCPILAPFRVTMDTSILYRCLVPPSSSHLLQAHELTTSLILLVKWQFKKVNATNIEGSSLTLYELLIVIYRHSVHVIIQCCYLVKVPEALLFQWAIATFPLQQIYLVLLQSLILIHLSLWFPANNTKYSSQSGCFTLNTKLYP